MSTRRLTPRQRDMLVRLCSGTERTPFTGGRNAGADASAWYRTATSLQQLGLVVLVRAGDARKATLTKRGLHAARNPSEPVWIPVENCGRPHPQPYCLCLLCEEARATVAA